MARTGKKQSSEEDVLLEWRDTVAIVTNNRPQKLNATSDAFNRRLWEVFYAINTNPDVRAVVWKANGPSFSSGRDLNELGGKRDNDMSHLQHIERGHSWTQMLLMCPAPIIVSLKGWVVGGMLERALLCDLRVGSESTKLWLPEARHGVVPDSGGMARLFQIAGHGLALDMALTCRVLDADEALRHGIISRVLPDEEVDNAAIEMAEAIAELPAFTVKLIRRDVARMATPLVQQSMEEEAILQAQVYASDDYNEMKRAKAEGRKPVYRRR